MTFDSGKWTWFWRGVDTSRQNQIRPAHSRQRREEPHRKLPEVGAIDVAIAVDVAEEVEEALKHQDLLSRRFGLGTKQHDRRSWFWRVENSAGAFNYLSS